MKRSIPVVLLLAIAACGGGATRPASAPEPARPGPLDATLTPYIESYGSSWGEWRAMSGYVMVAQHDQPLYARGFGYADRDKKLVPGPDTSFRIGSVTKQFTAAAILVLQQDGMLRVTDTIGAHLPDYPAVGAGVTIHQLLTHTSGIPSYTDDPAIMEVRDRPISVDALIASFADKPLDFAPGEAFAYSNSNYILLGAIIERASGMSYADFMRTRIFEPAGLTNTVVGDAPGALGYTTKNRELVPAHPIDMSVPYAAGAIRSTANDLVRWHRVLEGETILTEESKRAMYTPEKDGYGYGWSVENSGEHHGVAHDGGIDGFVTHYRRVLDLDLVVVVLSNNETFPMSVVGEAALAAALGDEVHPIVEPPLVPFDRAAAEAVLGTWALTDASRQTLADKGVPPEIVDTIVTTTFSIEDDQLVLTPVGQDPLVLVPTSAGTWIHPDVGVTVTFAGSTATLEQGGLAIEYVRRL